MILGAKKVNKNDFVVKRFTSARLSDNVFSIVIQCTRKVFERVLSPIGFGCASPHTSIGAEHRFYFIYFLQAKTKIDSFDLGIQILLNCGLCQSQRANGEKYDAGWMMGKTRMELTTAWTSMDLFVKLLWLSGWWLVCRESHRFFFLDNVNSSWGARCKKKQRISIFHSSRNIFVALVSLHKDWGRQRVHTYADPIDIRRKIWLHKIWISSRQCSCLLYVSLGFTVFDIGFHTFTDGIESHRNIIIGVLIENWSFRMVVHDGGIAAIYIIIIVMGVSHDSRVNDVVHIA